MWGIKFNHTHTKPFIEACFQLHYIGADSPSAVIIIDDKVARVVSVIDNGGVSLRYTVISCAIYYVLFEIAPVYWETCAPGAL